MKKIIYSAIALIALCGCSEGGDLAQGAYNGEVLLRSSIATRTVGDQWESGDEIGVRMSYGASGYESAQYTTDASGVLTSTSPLFYPTEESVDITAYYPYSLFNSDGVATLDISNQSDQGAIDLMVATAKDKYRNADPVELKFYHRMAQVVIGSIVSDEDLAELKVELVGAKTAGTYDLVQESFTTSGDAIDIAMKITADSKSAEAIVIPQSANITIRFTTKAGVIYYAILPKEELNGGICYRINSVTLQNNGAVLGEMTIGEWEYGNFENIEVRPNPDIYAVGDAYPSADNAIGIVCAVSDGGRHGKMLSTRESSYLHWSNNAKNTTKAEAIDRNDGLANMRAIIADGVDEYEAVSYVNNMNSDPKGYASGSTGVWYFPALNELGSISPAEWDKINATLTTLGYDEVSDQIWTSTLSDNRMAYRFDVSSANAHESTIMNTELPVRTMQRF